MWAVRSRFGVDLIVMVLGLVVALTLVMTLVDGVESARQLSGSDVSLTDWISWVLVKMPMTMSTVLPVASALGVAIVARRWAETGELVALFAVGVRPHQLMGWAFTSVVLSALIVMGTNEVIDSAVASSEATLEEWVSVDVDDGKTLMLKAGGRVGGAIAGISFAERDAGVVTSVGEVDRAHYTSSGWALEGISGYLIDSAGVPVPLSAVRLPLLNDWEAAANTPNAGSSIAALLRTTGSLGRTAWLGHRLVEPFGLGVLGILSFALVLLSRRFGLGLVLAVAVVWTLFGGALVSFAARGQWPTLLAISLPLLIAAGLAFMLAFAFEKRVGLFQVTSASG